MSMSEIPIVRTLELDEVVMQEDLEEMQNAHETDLIANLFND